MDGSHFDQLTRELVAHASRRHLLRWLTGSLAGALVGLRIRPADAACPPCGPCKTCDCSAGPDLCFCDPEPNEGRQCSPETDCRQAGVCTNGECVRSPKPNDTPCNTDSNPCTNDICQDGTCRHEPVANGTPCPDDGNECTLDECRFGQCQHSASPVDGNSCDGGAGVCSGGMCCPTATPTNCSGTCRNLKTDEQCCGFCCATCAETEICAACKGNCAGQFPAQCCPRSKRTNCSGVCVNTRTDEANCGRCGKRCQGAKVCRRGRCV